MLSPANSVLSSSKSVLLSVGFSELSFLLFSLRITFTFSSSELTLTSTSNSSSPEEM